MSGKRGAKDAYAKLSPDSRRLMARAGLDVMRGGPRSTELSNLTEFVEKDSHGKSVRHTRVDPAKVERAEELVRLGLAYVPSQPDRDKLVYVALTRLGEAAAVLAAKSAFGPRTEADARKFSVLDKASAHMSEALYHLEDGMKKDWFHRFNQRERRGLKELIRKTFSLRVEINKVRDGFEPDQDAPMDISVPKGGSDRGRVTRRVRA